jgi:hypothetical protein
MMKSLASATTPYRQRLHDVLVAREAERARKKAAPTRRKAHTSLIMPSLFNSFGQASLLDKTKDIDAESPPENIGEGTHGST